MPQAETQGRYADWLKIQMAERQLTQRSLARIVNPDDPETARRSIRRYLNGMVPIERSRRVISDALGTDDLGPGDVDSEDD